MALFDVDEVVRGRRLGVGGFSHVDEIVGFRPKKDKNGRFSKAELEARNLLANAAKCERGEARYVMKTIQPAMMNDENDFRMAAGSLANEADLLSKLDHPNIITLRGFPYDGVKAFGRMERYDGYFLILDRLDGTLSDLIESWKQELKRLRNPLFALKQLRRKEELFMRDRLAIALDIASALQYLHSKRIVYRDLKPDNCGILNGVTKLFDLGLARPMPLLSEARDDVMTGTFQMTGKVGTKIAMAPEVYERKPYNAKVDSYSMALLLWQMLSLERPFARHTKKMYRTRVVKKGERPPIDSLWPAEIQLLLKRGWSRDMNERPSMDQICSVLKKQVDSLGIYDKQRLVQSKSHVPNSVVPTAA